MEKKFKELALEGKVTIGMVHDFIERWHNSDCVESLGDYLGLTQEEYNNFVVREKSLGEALNEAKKSKMKKRKYTVYHHDKPNFQEVKKMKKDLMKVAEVMATDLEEVFALTNSIDEVWYNSKNPDIKVFRKSYSTSVGDIIECGGKYFEVAGQGYNEIDGTRLKDRVKKEEGIEME